MINNGSKLPGGTMDFNVKHDRPENLRSACVVVPIFAAKKMSVAAESLDKASTGKIRAILARGDLSGDKNQSLMLQQLPGLHSDRVLLLGMGKASELNAANFIKAVKCAVKQLQSASLSEAMLCFGDLEVEDRSEQWLAQQVVITAEDVCYQYDATKTIKKIPGQKIIKKIEFMYDSKKSGKRI